MWTFSKATPQITTSLNCAGGDTREVLAGLGVSNEEFEDLIQQGVIFVADDSAK